MLIVSPTVFTTWANMVPGVAEHATAVPIFVAEDHLRDVAREFFRLTRVWRSPESTLLTTVASQVPYAYTPPSNAELSSVHSAWAGSTKLEVIEPGEEVETEPGYTSDTYSVGARLRNVLYLAPAPLSGGVVINGTVSYVPSADAVGIPDVAWDEWRKAIAAGAAARLVAMPNKPWSNPDSVGYLRGLFDTAVREASNEAGPPRARPLRVRPA